MVWWLGGGVIIIWNYDRKSTSGGAGGVISGDSNHS